MIMISESYGSKAGILFWDLRLQFRKNAFTVRKVFWSELGDIFFNLYVMIDLHAARSFPDIRLATCSISTPKIGNERNGSERGKVGMLFPRKLHRGTVRHHGGICK